jgi:N6-L-threonylcarbamoyladenine synthase
MRILGIETSCDETACALIEMSCDGRFSILSEQVASQIDIHKEYGGVVPEIASREHLTSLPIVCDAVLREGGCDLKSIDGIGVTVGPGLKGCLLVGMCFAQGLSLSSDIPLLGINHIEGHILSPVLDNLDLDFPYLCLIVSGGHTEIVKVDRVGQYTILSRTLDDAAGEAFDKSANLLGFEYPGGRALALLADTVERSRYELPKVMRNQEGFSFSGLKTAVAVLVNTVKKELGIAKEKRLTLQMLPENILKELCFTIQEAIVDTLFFKLKKEMQSSGISKIAIAGGVAANHRLRLKITALPHSGVYFPKLYHCTDNAAMIAYTASLRFQRYGFPSKAQSIKVLPQFRIETVY